MHLPLSKQYGNAGRIAGWIFENIEDPLDYWEYGGVTGARSDIRLASGDTIVTLENKWWGVHGSLKIGCVMYGSPTKGPTCDSLLGLWNRRRLWAPVWLRESFSLSWGVVAARRHIRLHNPFYWNENEASERIRAAMTHKVY